MPTAKTQHSFSKKCLAMLASGLFFSTSLTAQAQGLSEGTSQGTSYLDRDYSEGISPAKEYSLTWATNLSNEAMVDDLSNRRNEIDLGVTLKFDMNFSSWLSMNITPLIGAQNGYIQAPDSQNPTGSQIKVLNASLDFKPVDEVKVSVGSLNQREYHSDIFMSNRSFPAARMVGTLGAAEDNHVYGFAESSVPTSSSVSNSTSDPNATPTLNMGGVGMQLGSEKSTFNFKGFVNAYQFSGLSQDLSTSSVLLGNSGLNTAGTTYLFAYSFSGYEALLDTSLNINHRFSVDAFAKGIENADAPTNSNQGWTLGSGAKYRMTRKLQIEPKFEYFRIESDSTVAIYNDSTFNTNREGYRTELGFRYKQKIHMYVGFGQRVPIVEMPSQPAESFYSIGFDTEESKLY